MTLNIDLENHTYRRVIEDFWPAKNKAFPRVQTDIWTQNLPTIRQLDSLVQICFSAYSNCQTLSTKAFHQKQMAQKVTIRGKRSINNSVTSRQSNKDAASEPLTVAIRKNPQAKLERGTHKQGMNRCLFAYYSCLSLTRKAFETSKFHES